MIHASELRALAHLRGAVREVWIALKALVPPSGRRVSRAKIAEVTGYDLRTVKRALNRLEEEGLVEIWRTDGGAHGNVNFVRVMGVKGRDVEGAGQRGAVEPEARRWPAEARARAVGQEVDGAAEPLPAGREDGAPSGDRDVCQRSDVAVDSGDGLDGDSWRTDANSTPAAGGTPAPEETIAQAADRMVREFHAGVRGDDGHVPLRREVNLARRLLEAHGAKAWALASAAVRTLHDQVRRGGSAPATFLYLLPHLTRAGARVGGGE